MKTQPTTCRRCRMAMRRWALDYRRVQEAGMKKLCLAVAKDFRSGVCYHNKLPKTQ